MRSVVRRLVLFGAPEPMLVLSVKPLRLDDERVAVPMAARVAVVLRHAVREMRPAVERNHARLVHHLVRDRDAVRALRDHDAVAVEHGAHAGAQAARDAAVVQREILERVERTRAERAVAGGSGGSRTSVGRQRRRAAVRGIDDERRETENAHAIRDAMEGLNVGRVIAAGLLTLRALDELLLAQELLRAERFRAVERNATHVVGRPGALQARMAPRRLRRSPVAVVIGRGLLLGRNAPVFGQHEVGRNGRIQRLELRRQRSRRRGTSRLLGRALLRAQTRRRAPPRPESPCLSSTSKISECLVDHGPTSAFEALWRTEPASSNGSTHFGRLLALPVFRQGSTDAPTTPLGQQRAARRTRLSR